MNDSNALVALSAAIASAVATIAPSVVYVDAHPRRDASGIVWDAHHVVTVDHAIERDDDIELRLGESARARATLVGRDPTTDVAVLHVRTPLVAAPRAVASALEVGNVALAIARDEDGAHAATFGIVSALDGPWRTWRGGEIDRFVRPDVTIGSGFSGGPLVDAAGALVGMNTWGLSRRHALTVPWTTLDRVVAQLLAGGRIRRGYLGVAVQPVRLPTALRAAHALDRAGGALVVDVAPGGPADRAGVTLGDVVLALGDAPVGDAVDLQRALGPASVGTACALAIVRGGEARTIHVAIVERLDDDA